MNGSLSLTSVGNVIDLIMTENKMPVTSFPQLYFLLVVTDNTSDNLLGELTFWAWRSIARKPSNYFHSKPLDAIVGLWYLLQFECSDDDPLFISLVYHKVPRHPATLRHPRSRSLIDDISAKLKIFIEYALSMVISAIGIL